MSNPLHLTSYGTTDVGRRRKHNEDVVLVRDDLALWVVADGAGGHNAGEVAAALAARSISNYIGATVRKAWEQPAFDRFGIGNGGKRIAAAIRKANKDVLEVAHNNNKYRDMVCTAVAASICERWCLFHVAHVGDSRCYRLRSLQLEQLTSDHSLLVEVLEREPDLDENIVERMPRNIVTRALGMDEHVRITFRTFPILPGDRYLLCSDGLSGMLGHDTIETILADPSPPKEAVTRLIQLANEAGGKDNISAIVIDIDSDVDLVGWAAPSAPAQTETIEDDSIELCVLGSDGNSVAESLSKYGSLPPEVIDRIDELFRKKTDDSE